MDQALVQAIRGSLTGASYLGLANRRATAGKLNPVQIPVYGLNIWVRLR